MELQTEIGDIERRFVSMIENCGVSRNHFPFPAPARQVPGTPSFLFPTSGSLTRVSALSNLAEDLTFCNHPYQGKDQSLYEDTVHMGDTTIEDVHDTTFFSSDLDKESEEKKFEEDTDTNQLVPVIDVDGEKIYRVVEGCETETKMLIKRPCCAKASPSMIDHAILKEIAKRPKTKRPKISHPQACSTFIGKDEVVEETIEDDDTSFRSTNDSSSTLYIEDDGTKKFPRTSTKINLSPETDIHCVPDITDSLFSGNSRNSDKRHRSQKKHSRHLATGDMDISLYSTLGSMGDDSVFQQSRVVRKGVPKTGLLRRQTCITQLVDPRALVKKMKRFNSNLRNKKINLAHTLLVI